MRRTVGALVVATIITSACTTTIEGTAAPDPAGSTTATAVPTPSADPVPDAGTRPATLALDDVDLCRLFPPTLEFQPGYQWPPLPDDEGKCVLRAPEGSYVIGRDPRSIDVFVVNPEVKATPFTIVGFPAVIGFNLPDEATSCFVNVDVQDGVNLEVSLQDGGAPGTDLLCPKAKLMATVAMGILPGLV